jgi:hypothetical protein
MQSLRVHHQRGLARRTRRLARCQGRKVSGHHTWHHPGNTRDLLLLHAIEKGKYEVERTALVNLLSY